MFRKFFFLTFSQPEKAAVAEHILKQAAHEILFQNTEVLDNTSNHYVRLHMEAIEIHKHQQSFNNKKESKTHQSLVTNPDLLVSVTQLH